jgi:hypothetical protein
MAHGNGSTPGKSASRGPIRGLVDDPRRFAGASDTQSRNRPPPRMAFEMGALSEGSLSSPSEGRARGACGHDAAGSDAHEGTSRPVCCDVAPVAMPPFDSAFVMATLVAARTRRIRIGTAVSLAAFYHSLRLAEEVVPAKAEEVARRGARWLVDS